MGPIFNQLHTRHSQLLIHDRGCHRPTRTAAGRRLGRARRSGRAGWAYWVARCWRWVHADTAASHDGCSCSWEADESGSMVGSAWRGMLLLGLSLLVVAASSGKRFDAFTSCAACVDAGFGWSVKKSKCGMFANKACDASGGVARPEAVDASSPPAPPQSYFGELPIIGAVPRMKWDLSDPNFATKLARRRTPVVLTDSPASAAWRGFDRWTEPGYLEERLPEPLNFAKSYDPNFMYYNKKHSWAEEARRIRADPAQRLGADWGNWVVPSVDIKLTLAGFHREANSSWASALQPPPSTCAKENNMCDCPPGGRVRYGAAPKWSRWRRMRTGEDAVACGNDIFGDPSPGVGKQCQCELPVTAVRRERERWVYHSKALTSSAPWAPVLADVAPTNFFWVAPTHPAVSETQNGPIAHLWYGSAGSRTRPHFDFYENFFVQVLGEKRWLLAPPAAYGEMYVLPSGHPSGRQSALDWPHLNITAYPRATANPARMGLLRSRAEPVGLLETKLKPQEVLYCPPVWFHSTEAVGPGPNLGLSFWSESETQTRQNVLRSEVANACRQGRKITSPADKRRLVRTLGVIIATALGLPKATGPKLMSPEVAAEYVAISGRFCHKSAEFELKCSDNIPDGGPSWIKSAKADDGADVAIDTWPCLVGRAERFVSQYSELAEGATTTVASDTGLMRALIGSYLESVAEAVLLHDTACRFFAESSAALEVLAATATVAK